MGHRVTRQCPGDGRRPFTAPRSARNHKPRNPARKHKPSQTHAEEIARGHSARSPAELAGFELAGFAVFLSPLHPPGVDPMPEGRLTVKVEIDPGRCQGHGRCYDIDPGLFGDDNEGYGRVLGVGLVPPDQEHAARIAAASCPERAITLAEEA
jgi:ferredoxin